MSAVELSTDPHVRVDALYRAYRQDVYHCLLRDLGSPADADDGTQAVFLSAFRALDRGCRPHAARAWLLAIAKNVARRTWRERGRAAAELEPDAVAAAEPADEARRELVAVLETLPEGQRTALVLHELYGLQYGEISQVTRQSVAGVETSVFRARRAVRTAMLGEGSIGHEAAAKLLKRFVAGKLTRNERESLQAHIAHCAECAAAETTLRSTRRRNHVLQWVFALPSGVQRLLGYIQAAPLQGAGAAAVFAVALVGAAGDGSSRRDPATTPERADAVRAAQQIPAGALAIPLVPRGRSEVTSITSTSGTAAQLGASAVQPLSASLARPTQEPGAADGANASGPSVTSGSGDATVTPVPQRPSAADAPAASKPKSPSEGLPSPPSVELAGSTAGDVVDDVGAAVGSVVDSEENVAGVPALPAPGTSAPDPPLPPGGLTPPGLPVSG